MASTGYLSGVKRIDQARNANTIDLRSDTVTKPSQAMREAMANAVVGDDVYKEDPTINELERRAAELFGKQAALFVPSGTMGNLISIMCHCSHRGDELIVGEKQHIFKYEQGGSAQIAGVSSFVLPNAPDGTIRLEDLRRALRTSSDFHDPRSRLVCLENTHNVCGGRVLRSEYVDQVSQFAKENGLLLHLDGARVYNAAVALSQSVAQVVQRFDSVTMSLSKGLGAPVGALIGGSLDFIERATRVRKVLGGGMRQCGILAAAGIVAFETAEAQLREDHKNAKILATGINEIGRDLISVDIESVETNIVFAKLADSVNTEKFVAKMAKASSSSDTRVLCLSLGSSSVRFVTHCDVSSADIHNALQKIQETVDNY